MKRPYPSMGERFTRLIVVSGFALTILIGVSVAHAAPSARAVRAVGDHAVVFVYHRFGDSRHPDTNTPIPLFKAQLAWLASHHFHVWSLPRLVRALESGMPVPDHTVAITVDDAFETVYTHAWPLLRRYGWPMTIFVSTRAVNRGYPDYMTWAQMRILKSHGVTFGDHTVTHPHMLMRPGAMSQSQWLANLRSQIVKAQRQLRKHLGEQTNTKPKLFAYPYGEYNGKIASLVNRLGFIAFSQAAGALGPIHDGRALPRFPINGTYGKMKYFSRRANARPLPVANIQPWSPVVHRQKNPPVLRLKLQSVGTEGARMHCYSSAGRRLPVKPLKKKGDFEIKARGKLPVGRSLYTCTVRNQQGQWYWYTHPWFLMPKRVHGD